jgi:hypothetical protein
MIVVTPPAQRAWFVSICAKLASFFRHTPPTHDLGPLSLAELEAEFARQFEVRVSSPAAGGYIVIRQRPAGSFGAERGILARFLKQALSDKGLSHWFSNQLIESFRSWLLADAKPLAQGELFKHNLPLHEKD